MKKRMQQAGESWWVTVSNLLCKSHPVCFSQWLKTLCCHIWNLLRITMWKETGPNQKKIHCKESKLKNFCWCEHALGIYTLGRRIRFCEAHTQATTRTAAGKQDLSRLCSFDVEPYKEKPSPGGGGEWERGGEEVRGSQFHSVMLVHVSCFSSVIALNCWRRPDVLLESPHLDLITPNSPSQQALCH